MMETTEGFKQRLDNFEEIEGLVGDKMLARKRFPRYTDDDIAEEMRNFVEGMGWPDDQTKTELAEDLLSFLMEKLLNYGATVKALRDVVADLRGEEEVVDG